MNHFLKKHRRTTLIGLGGAMALTAAWQLRPFDFGNTDAPPSKIPETPTAALDTALVLPPPIAKAAEPIRPEIQSAIDTKTAPALRTELVQSLPEDLSEAEWRILLREILALPAPGAAEAWHSSHVHEICKVLQRIPACHDLFASTLATVAASRDFTEVYRDYAFQHLRILWRRSLEPLAPGVAQPRNIAIEKTFRQLLTDRPETSAQAILGLHEFRYDDATPALSDQEINSLVSEILTSADHTAPAYLPTRMTAIRIIAERNLPQAGETLRTIASSPQEHMLVRISAIGALGHTAAPADADFLRTLSPDHPLIADALQHALKLL